MTNKPMTFAEGIEAVDQAHAEGRPFFGRRLPNYGKVLSSAKPYWHLLNPDATYLGRSADGTPRYSVPEHEPQRTRRPVDAPLYSDGEDQPVNQKSPPPITSAKANQGTVAAGGTAAVLAGLIAPVYAGWKQGGMDAILSDPTLLGMAIMIPVAAIGGLVMVWRRIWNVSNEA